MKDPFWDQSLPHEGIDGTVSTMAYIHALECQVITLEEQADKQQRRINRQRREIRALNRKILDMIRGARMVTNQATDAIDSLEG